MKISHLTIRNQLSPPKSAVVSEVAASNKSPKDNTAPPRIDFVLDGDYIQAGESAAKPNSRPYTSAYEAQPAPNRAIATYNTVSNIWSADNFSGQYLHAYA